MPTLSDNEQIGMMRRGSLDKHVSVMGTVMSDKRMSKYGLNVHLMGLCVEKKNDLETPTGTNKAFFLQAKQ